MSKPHALRFRIAFLALVAFVAGSLLDAQTSASLPSTDAHSCKGARPGRDSATVDVYLALGPTALSSREWDAETHVLSPEQHRQLEAMLQFVRARFPKSALVPAELAFPLDGGDLDYVKVASASVPSLWSATTFTVHDDGRITDVRIKDSSRSPPLDSAIVNTLAALGAERTLAGLQRERTEGAAEPLRLTLTMGYWPTAAVPMAVLATIRAPSFEVTPSQPVRDNPHPPYPAELLAQRVEGDVLVRFVVDGDGRADMTTVRILKATHDRFMQSVMSVLPELRFEASRINGCPARELAHLPFQFRVRR